MDSEKIEHTIEKRKRFFVDALTKAAKIQDVEIEWLSGDWVCKLSKNGKTDFVYGYNFPLNSATGFEVARDKTIVSKLLQDANVPCATHELFLNKNNAKYVDGDNQEKRLLQFVETYRFPLVCKDNRGAGGYRVYKVNSREELETNMNMLWDNSRGVALSPFYQIENEYRFFVLDGKIELMYKKIIPHVVGDGVSPVSVLIEKQIQHSHIEILKKEKTFDYLDFKYIPKEKEIFEIGWKFNLSKGGRVELIDSEGINEVSDIVLQAVKVLQLGVCSVDVIKIKDSNEYRVLEVNTGITTEHFAQTSSEAQKIAEELYSKILLKIFS